MSPIAVRTVSAAEHLTFITAHKSVSFLQTPAWGEVKSQWRRESIGWFRGDEMVGVGLVLYRQLPKITKFLAYLPEGPVLDWSADDLPLALKAMAEHLKNRGAFGIRMGPPVAVRTWSADTIKKAIADDTSTRLGDVPADTHVTRGDAVMATLRAGGWIPQGTEAGFAAGQPQFVFQIPLAGKTDEEVLGGMNQLWRRNIKKAAKLGVEVTVGTADDLAEFHALYVETAGRDHFTPRPLEYFQQMFTVLQAEDPDRIRLYLARHGGEVVAATTWVRVGDHTWYSYGASSTAKRDVRGSNAVQWRMIQDSLVIGATVYDLRGITETLDSEDPHIGLLQFKVGTGGQAVQYVGEWDLPLNKLLYRAFDLYMRRR